MSYSAAQKTQAQKKVDDLLNSAPGKYVSSYQDKIDSTLEKINNRQPFSYDFNADALYRQYKDRYAQAGKMSMLDAQADAAAQTGGFENSYGATAGQQAYQQQLANASQMIPELQNNAFSRYTAEGDELYDRLSAYQNAEQLAYQKYQNDVANYYNALNYWAGVANSAAETPVTANSTTSKPYVSSKDPTAKETVNSMRDYLIRNNLLSEKKYNELNAQKNSLIRNNLLSQNQYDASIQKIADKITKKKTKKN